MVVSCELKLLLFLLRFHWSSHAVSLQDHFSAEIKVKAVIMVFISNHYSNCKGLKITNESDPVAFRIGEKNVLVSKPEKLPKIEGMLHKYLSRGEGGRKYLVLAWVRIDNPTCQQ
jgi:hypothetical protein